MSYAFTRVLCIFSGLLFVLIIRTGYRQLWDGPNSGAFLAAKALKLRSQSIPGEEFNRGEILDRHLVSLTDSAVRPTLVAFPSAIKDITQTAEQLQDLIGLDSGYTQGVLQRALGTYGIRTPVVLRVNLTETEAKTLQHAPQPGLAVLPIKNR